MAEFHTVCLVRDLPEGRSRAIRVGTKMIAVFHHGGQFYAIDDMCPHMGSPLVDGHVENGIVTCNWHAWRFRLADGAWADNPRIKIGCYPVQVVDGVVQVRVSEASK